MSIHLDDLSLPENKPPSKDGSLFDWLNKDIQLFGNQLSLKKKEFLYNELMVLLSAGLDIQSSLELIEESKKNKKDKALIADIRQNVVSGLSLSEALIKSGKFSLYESHSVRIGEETGQLIPVLSQLSTYFNKSLKYKRQLLGALSYPAFVTGFAILAVFFLLNYLVPMFAGLYERFDSNLPPITQTIVQLSNWVGQYAWLCALILFGLSLIIYWQRNQLWLRKLSSSLIIRLPIFGPIVKKIYLARFCQSMSMLLLSKVPLLQSVELVREMIRFYPLENSLGNAEKEITNGSMLYDALKQYSFYPKQLLALVKVGEEASKLGEMFEKLASQYNEEVDQKTAVVGSLIEPILIIVLGAIVAVILVAMYLPLFKLSTTIGN